jgi:hypothetical protein
MEGRLPAHCSGDPADVIFDSSGNLYISDSINDLIREINSSGTISTFAGSCPATPCTGAFAGDGGAATKASLNSPSGMTFDSSANFYIADTDNFEIRKVTGGTISTVAGENSLGASFAGDLGAATSAGLWNSSGVAVDPAGNIYIADAYNNVVRVVCQTQTPIACTNNAFIGGVVWAAGDINTFAGNNATGAGYHGRWRRRDRLVCSTIPRPCCWIRPAISIFPTPATALSAKWRRPPASSAPWPATVRHCRLLGGRRTGDPGKTQQPEGHRAGFLRQSLHRRHR